MTCLVSLSTIGAISIRSLRCDAQGSQRSSDERSRVASSVCHRRRRDVRSLDVGSRPEMPRSRHFASTQDGSLCTIRLFRIIRLGPPHPSPVSCQSNGHSGLPGPARHQRPRAYVNCRRPRDRPRQPVGVPGQLPVRGCWKRGRWVNRRAVSRMRESVDLLDCAIWQWRRGPPGVGRPDPSSNRNVEMKSDAYYTNTHICIYADNAEEAAMLRTCISSEYFDLRPNSTLRARHRPLRTSPQPFRSLLVEARLPLLTVCVSRAMVTARFAAS
jgi:hypothetical protein